MDYFSKYFDEENKRHSLSDATYYAIRNALINADIKPGERLKDSDIAENLNISRSPIRYALQRLYKEGFLDQYTGSGYIVPKWEMDKCLDIVTLFKTLILASVRIIEKNITTKEIGELEMRSITIKVVEDYRQKKDLMELFLKYIAFFSHIVKLSNNPVIIREYELTKNKIIMMRHLYPDEMQQDFPYGKYIFSHRQIIDSFKGKRNLPLAHVVLDEALDGTIIIRHMYQIREEWK